MPYHRSIGYVSNFIIIVPNIILLILFQPFFQSVLAESTREKEDNATDASFSYSSKKLYLANYNASYRLIGSVFLTPEDIVSSCNSERFESNLCSGLRKEQRSQKKSLDRRSTFSPENGGKLALRIRKASEFDQVFIRTLRHCDVNNVRMTIDMLNDAVRENDPTRPHLEPVTITTEYDEKEIGVQASLKAIGDLSPQAFESVSDVKSGFLVRHQTFSQCNVCSAMVGSVFILRRHSTKSPC